MLKLKVDYPSKDEELAILERMSAVEPDLMVDVVLERETLWKLRSAIDRLYMDDQIKRYIVDVVHATRRPAEFGLDLAPYIQYGASPRATIFLTRAAKAEALLQGRGFVTPQDVKSIGFDVLRHRVCITFEAEAEDMTAESILKQIYDHVRVP
jgi:MoxR-like ATPase